MDMTPLPLPEPDLASARFFAALDAGRLTVQRCNRCGTAHLAVLVCDACGAGDFSEAPASGGGTLYSFTKMHIAHHPAFAARLPACGGIVELDEGPRLFAPLLGAGQFQIGSAVMAELLPVEGRVIAAFRLADQSHAG